MKFLRYLLIGFLGLAVIAAGIYLANMPEAIPPLLNALLMLGMPLALGVYLARRLKVEWRVFGIGALTFIGSQILHIPFNSYALNPLIEKWGLSPLAGSLDLVIMGLLFGFSAGLFEESARYLVYRIWLKDDRRWRDGLMFGAGHGGIEAILAGALALAAFLQALSFRTIDPSTLPADQATALQDALALYWRLPWYDYLLGAVERLGALCFHLSAAVLVLQAVRRRNLLWLVAAIAWHTTINAVAIYGATTWGVYLTEALVVLIGLVSLWIVFTLRPKGEGGEPEEPPKTPAPPPPVDLGPQEITTEKLEDSRYD
jgi:uncharacterized membrane protein YhfC